MRRFGIYGVLLFLLGCGEFQRLPYSSLSETQPQVLEVIPVDGAENYEANWVEVRLSKPVASETVGPESFFVTPLEGSEETNWLAEAVLEGKLNPSEGTYEILEEGTRLRFISEDSFFPDRQMGIIVTPFLLSKDRLPLNQTPGEGPVPFISRFSTPINLEAKVAEAPLVTSRPEYLVLNEIFYDADGRDAEGDLFIELKGDAEANLSGYSIIIINGENGDVTTALQVPNGYQTSEEGFFVLADSRTGLAGITNVIGADWVKNFDPPNGPDCIQLLDPEGNLVDVVGYGTPLVLRAENNRFCYETLPAPDAPGGTSLSRLPDAEDTNNNQADWVINYAPSPGTETVQDVME